MSSIKTQESQDLVCPIANKRVSLSWIKVQMRGGPFVNTKPDCSEIRGVPPICSAVNKGIHELNECLAHRICS